MLAAQRVQAVDDLDHAALAAVGSETPASRSNWGSAPGGAPHNQTEHRTIEPYLRFWTQLELERGLGRALPSQRSMAGSGSPLAMLHATAGCLAVGLRRPTLRSSLTRRVTVRRRAGLAAGAGAAPISGRDHRGAAA